MIDAHAAAGGARTPRQLTRRAELVRAAAEAIEAHGPQVRVETLSEHAGLARPLLYRYFAGLEDLQQAVIDEAARDLVAHVSTAVGTPDSDLEGVVRGTADSYLSWVHDHPNLARYCLRAAPSARDVSALRRRVADLIKPVLASYVPGLSELALETLAATVVGMAEATATWWLEGPQDCDHHALSQLLGRRLMTVLAAEAP